MLERADLGRLAEVGSYLSLGQLNTEWEIIELVLDSLQGPLAAQMVGMILIEPEPVLFYTTQAIPPENAQIQLENHLLGILESLQFPKTLHFEHHPILNCRAWEKINLEGLISLPLVIEKNLAGLIFASRSPDQEAFSTIDLALLAMICGQFSMTFIVLQLNRKLGKQNQQLKHLNQYREEFIRNISHDLRTPLTCVLGYAELLQQHSQRLSPAQHSEFTAQILSKAKTLRILVDNLLNFNNNQSQKTILAQPCDLNVYLEEALYDIKPLLEEKNQKIRVRIAPDLPPVLGDGPLIVKVLLNLLHNSQKFSPVGGELLLEAHYEEQSVQVCVRDNGPGIAPEALERVFEKFHREDLRPIQSSAEGIGLGLAVCKDIIQALKGEIWAENRRNGTAFCFELRRVLQETN